MTIKLTITLLLLILFTTRSLPQNSGSTSPDSDKQATVTDSAGDNQRNFTAGKINYATMASSGLAGWFAGIDTIPFLRPKAFITKPLDAIGLSGSKQDIFNFKKHFSPLAAGFKKPVVLHNAMAVYNVRLNESYFDNGNRSYYGDFLITSNWSVATVPFEVQINNQTWNDIAVSNLSNVLVHFNREIYLEQLRKKLQRNFNPEEFLQNTLRDQVEAITSKAESALREELQSLNKQFGNVLKDQVEQLGNLRGLMTKDMQSVRQQLLNVDFVKDLAGKQKLLSELMVRKNAGGPVDEKMLARLSKEVGGLKGVQGLIAKIEEHKSRWESSGLLKKIRQLEMLNRKQLEEMAKNPAAIAAKAKQYLNLNGFQKLFLKINKLNIGRNTLNASKLSMQHLMNKGINTEILNNNRYLMAGMGKLQNLNAIYDQVFDENLYAGDGLAKMFRIGIGNPAATHSHISVMSYDQAMNQPGIFAPLNSFRTTMVTTITNQLNIGQQGMLTVELSRSATSYQNTPVSDSALRNKPALQQVLGSDNFGKNLAFSLRYADEFPDNGLSYSVHAGKTAQGYTNPGNSFLSSGGKELGISVRKLLAKRKLQASLRTEIREYDYSTYADNKWRSFYAVMDVQWKIKRGQSIGIRYIPNRMTKIYNGSGSLVSSADRLSINGNVSARFAGEYYRNNLNISWQQNRQLWDRDVFRNATLSLSSYQSFTLKSKLLYLNINYDYTRNNSLMVYFNSSFLSEAGVTYQLFRKLSLTSAISYNSVQEWYQQLGIKQIISTAVSDRFSLNAYVDARKNLKLTQPLLFGPVRADIAIHYLFRK